MKEREEEVRNNWDGERDSIEICRTSVIKI